ncbi:hypothetical protein C8046_11695 [Serinibacter arcticus]|uniref:Uncharacterized protein n=1 Tax=Serinibacter arcticus TaxID=1655435 RepID=A0A2U1ZW46_9MICO|nr:hypothetical protein [Serinibacter arcticus]PWD51216.1 hypothetical protein C8046_11695 [Serinibacter arcticus]
MVYHELVAGTGADLSAGALEIRLQVTQSLASTTRVEVRSTDGGEAAGLIRHLPLVVAFAHLEQGVRVSASSSSGFPAGAEVTISIRVEAPGRRSDEVVAERLQVGGQREAALVDIATTDGGLRISLPRADAALGSVADHARGVARSSGLPFVRPTRVVVDASASMGVYARDGRLATAAAMVQGVLASADVDVTWVLAGREISAVAAEPGVDLPDRLASAVATSALVGSSSLEQALTADPTSWVITDLPPAGWEADTGGRVLTLADALDSRPGVHHLPPTPAGPEGTDRRRDAVLALLADQSARGEVR